VKLFDIRLDEDDIFVTVAERQNAQHGTLIRKDPFSDLALVRSFSGQGMRTSFASFNRFGIPILSLLLMLLKFSDSKGIITSLSNTCNTLYYITGNPLLNEIRLAAIAGLVRPPRTD